MSNEAFVDTDGEKSAADVVAESLARDWIDQPAVARRAELQQRLSDAVASRRPSRLTPLGPAALRQLKERHHALTRSLAASEMTREMAISQLRQANARRAGLERRIQEAEVRLGRAQATIADLDRPLRRRRHRAERTRQRERPQPPEAPSRTIEASSRSSTLACRSSTTTSPGLRKRWASDPASRWSAAPFSPASTSTCRAARRH